MTKEHKLRKNERKKPALSLKEKRARKHEKRSHREHFHDDHPIEEERQ